VNSSGRTQFSDRRRLWALGSLRSVGHRGRRTLQFRHTRIVYRQSRGCQEGLTLSIEESGAERFERADAGNAPGVITVQNGTQVFAWPAHRALCVRLIATTTERSAAKEPTVPEGRLHCWAERLASNAGATRR
jgi:hypothetical protein